MLDTIGERLRWAREQAELSSRELARLACLSAAHVSLIETTDRGVNVRTLIPLARVLGVSLDWLATGEGDVPTALGLKRAITRARTGTDG